MKRNISNELNNVNLIKYALYKDYHIPEDLSFINLTQERILMTVKDSVNVSMVSIARAIGLEKGPFSQTVDKLENLNLIERVRSIEDKRLVNLHLTEKGNLLVSRVQKSMDEHFDKAVENLSEQELDQFFDALETLKTTANKLLKNNK